MKWDVIENWGGHIAEKESNLWTSNSTSPPLAHVIQVIHAIHALHIELTISLALLCAAPLALRLEHENGHGLVLERGAFVLVVRHSFGTTSLTRIGVAASFCEEAGPLIETGALGSKANRAVIRVIVGIER